MGERVAYSGLNAASRWVRVARAERLPTFGILLLLTAISGADEPADPAPKLSTVQESLAFEVQEEELLDTKPTPGVAKGTLILTNEGTEPADGLNATAYFRGSNDVDVTLNSDGALIDQLAQNVTVPIELAFTIPVGVDVDSGWLAIRTEDPTTGEPQAPPLVVPFQLREQLSGSVFLWVAAAAGLVALALVVITYLLIRLPTGGARPALNQRVFPAGSWSFSGSLASSITTLGAVLATILATSGFLTEVLPGVSIGVFLGASIGFGLLASIAAAVYTLANNAEGKPTYLSLLAAAAVTLWAVVGQLSTVGLLAREGGVSLTLILTLSLAAIALLVAYAHKSILQVVLEPAPVPPVTICICAPPDEVDEAVDRTFSAIRAVDAFAQQSDVTRPTALL